MVPKVLLVAVGLPASGKSTFVAELKRTIERREARWRVAVVCFDRLIPLREQIAAVDAQSAAVKRLRKRVIDVVGKIMQQFSGENHCPVGDDDGDAADDQETRVLLDAVLSDMNKTERVCVDNDLLVVIVDDNCYYRSMRHAWHSTARRHRAGSIGVFIDCDLATCLSRNASRAADGKVDDAVIRRMSQVLEKPTVGELDKIITLTGTDTQTNCGRILEELAQLRLHVIERPPEDLLGPEAGEQSAADRLTSHTNNVHQFDLVIRAAIKSRMAVERNACAGLLFARAKQEMLKDVRLGVLTLPSPGGDAMSFAHVMLDNYVSKISRDIS